MSLNQICVLKCMSLSFNIPIFDVPDVSEIHIPFKPYPYILYPLNNSMFLKLMSLVFYAPDVPQVDVLFIPCPSY